VAVVRDVHHPTKSSTASVTIYIMDANDHNPVWVVPSQHNTTTVVRLSSYTAVGTPVARVRAVDADDDENARVTYSTTSAAGGHHLNVLENASASTAGLYLDARKNARVSYSTTAAGGHHLDALPFDVDPHTGIIRLSADLSNVVRV